MYLDYSILSVILYTKKSGITCPAGQVWHNADKVGGHVNGYDNDTKILAAHAGLDKVEAGQLIEADLDLVLGMILPALLRSRK